MSFTVTVDGKSVTTIPDSMTGAVIEVKDVNKLSNSKQIKAERQLAKTRQMEFQIYTGVKTRVSKNIPKNEIVWRTDLGPR